MNKTLVVLAAGMGSRFGGLKQIEPVGLNGEFIIDYSVYDALKAGFNKIVFIIKKEHFDTFRETIGQRCEKYIDVEYAFQEIDYNVIPKKRVKPLGTGHALLCAKDYVGGPFAVISSDDFYGAKAFLEASNFMDNQDGAAIIGFKANETINNDEEVKRGIIIEENNNIKNIIECKVRKDENKLYCESLDGTKTFTTDFDTYAGMLMYAFNINIFERLESDYKYFLENADLLKDEFILTSTIDDLIKKNQVTLIKSQSKWLGMTYKEDLDIVKSQIKEYIDAGIYKENLWENK